MCNPDLLVHVLEGCLAKRSLNQRTPALLVTRELPPRRRYVHILDKNRAGVLPTPLSPQPVSDAFIHRATKTNTLASICYNSTLKSKIRKIIFSQNLKISRKKSIHPSQQSTTQSSSQTRRGLAYLGCVESDDRHRGSDSTSHLMLLMLLL